MTTEEWKKVEAELNSLFRGVELKCDEYEVIYKVTRTDTFKFTIMTYIKDEGEYKFCGSWLTNKEEKVKKLCRRKTMSYYSTKTKKHYIEIFGKREAKKRIDFDEKLEYYTPYWTNFNSLKKHLLKNNKSIELVKTGVLLLTR